jgi:hypothetical protein
MRLGLLEIKAWPQIPRIKSIIHSIVTGTIKIKRSSFLEINSMIKLETKEPRKKKKIYQCS